MSAKACTGTSATSADRTADGGADSKRKRSDRTTDQQQHSHQLSCSNGDSAFRDLVRAASDDDDDDSSDSERSRAEKKRKWTRLLLRELYDLGYSASAAALESEAHVQLRSEAMEQLQQCVEAREWDRALQLVGHDQQTSVASTVAMKSPQDARAAVLLLLKRKFLDLVIQKQLRAALATLHREIVPAFPLSADDAQSLAMLLLCRDARDVERIATIPWRTADLLARLEELASPEEIIPRGTLSRLVRSANDAVERVDNTHRPNTRVTGECVAMLLAHTSDVLDVQFAPSGALLASSARDGDVIVWTLPPGDALAHRSASHQQPAPLHVLKRADGAVECLAWSPDSRSLLTCSSASRTIEQWSAVTGAREHEFVFPAANVTSVQWLPSGQQFVSGSADKSLLLWNVADGSVAYQWGGRRVLDVAVHPNGQKLFALVSGTEVRTYDLQSKTDELLFEADALISCLRLSPSGQYLLLNLVGSESLVCLELDAHVIVATYSGVREQRFVLRPCFSGHNSDRIVCGSEDGTVCVWQRDSGRLAVRLDGHASVVNCVQCHPLLPHVVASASDDESVRLWVLRSDDDVGDHITDSNAMDE